MRKTLPGVPPRPTTAGLRLLVLFVIGVLAAISAGACSNGSAQDPESRSRPTDTAGLHDHSGENSALSPETVQAADIAALGDGPGEGEEFSGFLGVNVCGRFVELPEQAPRGALAVDTLGRVSISPGPGDDQGHDVTVGDLLALMDLHVATGEMAFGPSWSSTTAPVAGEDAPLGGVELATGDSCGREPGEVQLWYYTEEATDSGERIRVVVTDPQDVPIATDGAAITIAFAPVSSLPTLPPAVMAS